MPFLKFLLSTHVSESHSVSASSMLVLLVSGNTSSPAFSCQGLFEALTYHTGKSLLGRFFIIRNCSFPFWVLLHIDVCTVSAEGIFGLCHLVHSKSRVVRWLEQFLEADPTATELALHSLDFWFWFKVFYLPFEPHWAVFLSLVGKAWLSVCLSCIN